MANMKIEMAISTTVKPSIMFRLNEVDGTETEEQMKAMREVAWNEFEEDKKKTLEEFRKLKMELN
jgi:hypothetical protein